MDTYIQTLSNLLVDWQQLAINNLNFSIGLSLAGFLIGLLIVNFFKKKEVVTLQNQLIEEKKALEDISKKREELIVTQRNDAKIMTDFQQEKEHLLNEFQKSTDIHTELKNKYDLQLQSIHKQEIELNNLKSTVNGKTDEINQLQAEVDQQAVDLKNSDDKAELSTEFDVVKQQLFQLQSELDVKNEQIEQFENTTHSFNEDVSNIPEQTNQQHTQQLADFNKKLKLLLVQGSAQEGVQNRSFNRAGSGLFDKVLNMFSSIDNTLSTDIDSNHPDEKTDDDDIWLQHQKIIDQVINQFSIQPGEAEHRAITTEDGGITEDEVVIDNKSGEKLSVISKNIPPEIAEKFKEMTEKTDQFQEKLKGLYQKISS